MLNQVAQLRHICGYLITCVVFGGFISMILLYQEYNRFSTVSSLLKAGGQMFIKEKNCSGILGDNVPVLDSEGAKSIGENTKIPFLKTYKNPCWYQWLNKKSRFDQNVESLQNEECPLRFNCLPYFMIIGQPKCATTDLFFRLSLHPQIEPGIVKGPHWWTRKRYNGVNFSEYVKLFDEAAQVIRKTRAHPTDNFQYDVVTGEASPSTLWDTFGHAAPSNDKKKTFKQVIAAKIKSVIPEVKLIVILRNPVERLYSDYLYFKNDTKSPENFHLLANKSVTMFNNCMRSSTVSYCLHNYYVKQQLQVRLNLGIYAVYLQEWYKVFPKEQIFVVNFDDYVSNMKDCLTRIFNFLQLRKLDYEESSEILMQPPLNVNQRTHKYSNMLPRTRRLLTNFYAKFNTQLARLLNNKAFLWESPKKLRYEKF